MKRKIVLLLTTVLVLIISIALFACNSCDKETEHVHSFTERVVSEKYLASAATCTEAATYYYSCSCGEKGSTTFVYGQATGHSFATEWSHDSTNHWHAATCGHDVKADNAVHSFDKDGVCTVCGFNKTLNGVELKSTVFTMDYLNKTATLQVSNATASYDLTGCFTVDSGATLKIYTDYAQTTELNDLSITLEVGDKNYWVSVTNGEKNAVYTVTIHRRAMYTVAFDTNGGTDVEPKQVEEGTVIEEPTVTKTGYTLSWDYDFANPITTNVTITASWTATQYKITYVLGICENGEGNPTTYTIEDAEITLALPIKTGYECSWDNGGKIESGSTGDKTFTASYTVIIYNITYNYSGEETIDANPLTYTVNTNTITLALPTAKEGYHFSWSDGGKIARGSTGDKTFTLNVIADVTLSVNGTTVTGLNNTEITELVILSEYYGKEVTSINTGAFSGKTSLTKVTIKDGITAIGDNAFENCTALASITLPSDLTNLGNYAFSGCTALTSIKIPGGVNSIGNYAFSGCTALTSVTLLEGITSIGSSAFINCTHLTQIIIPDSVVSIEQYTFKGCARITSVVIGSGVTSIGNGAFEEDTRLSTVYYKGSESQWGNINIATTNNTYLIGATRYYYSESEPSGAGNYWHYVNGEPTKLE